MGTLIPGKIITTFTTEENQTVVLRYPMWEDLDSMTDFINAISREDTYVTFSGETIYKDGEMHYLSEMFKSMELGNSVYISCFIDGNMAGSATVIRDMQGRKRSYHVGIFGITLAKEFRGKGIGQTLAKVTLQEAKRRIPGLTMFTLNVYSPNEIAQSVYKKLGFTQCGVTPKAIWFRGEYIDEIKMLLPITDRI